MFLILLVLFSNSLNFMPAPVSADPPHVGTNANTKAAADYRKSVVKRSSRLAAEARASRAREREQDRRDAARRAAERKRQERAAAKKLADQKKAAAKKLADQKKAAAKKLAAQRKAAADKLAAQRARNKAAALTDADKKKALAAAAAYSKKVADQKVADQKAKDERNKGSLDAYNANKRQKADQQAAKAAAEKVRRDQQNKDSVAAYNAYKKKVAAEQAAKKKLYDQTMRDEAIRRNNYNAMMAAQKKVEKAAYDKAHGKGAYDALQADLARENNKLNVQNNQAAAAQTASDRKAYDSQPGHKKGDYDKKVAADKKSAEYSQRSAYDAIYGKGAYDKTQAAMQANLSKGSEYDKYHIINDGKILQTSKPVTAVKLSAVQSSQSGSVTPTANAANSSSGGINLGAAWNAVANSGFGKGTGDWLQAGMHVVDGLRGITDAFAYGLSASYAQIGSYVTGGAEAQVNLQVQLNREKKDLAAINAQIKAGKPLSQAQQNYYKFLTNKTVAAETATIQNNLIPNIPGNFQKGWTMVGPGANPQNFITIADNGYFGGQKVIESNPVTKIAYPIAATVFTDPLIVLGGEAFGAGAKAATLAEASGGAVKAIEVGKTAESFAEAAKVAEGLEEGEQAVLVMQKSNGIAGFLGNIPGMSGGLTESVVVTGSDQALDVVGNIANGSIKDASAARELVYYADHAAEISTDTGKIAGIASKASDADAAATRALFQSAAEGSAQATADTAAETLKGAQYGTEEYSAASRAAKEAEGNLLAAKDFGETNLAVKAGLKLQRLGNNLVRIPYFASDLGKGVSELASNLGGKAGEFISTATGGTEAADTVAATKSIVNGSTRTAEEVITATVDSRMTQLDEALKAGDVTKITEARLSLAEAQDVERSISAGENLDKLTLANIDKAHADLLLDEAKASGDEKAILSAEKTVASTESKLGKVEIAEANAKKIEDARAAEEELTNVREAIDTKTQAEIDAKAQAQAYKEELPNSGRTAAQNAKLNTLNNKAASITRDLGDLKSQEAALNAVISENKVSTFSRVADSFNTFTGNIADRFTAVRNNISSAFAGLTGGTTEAAQTEAAVAKSTIKLDELKGTIDSNSDRIVSEIDKAVQAGDVTKEAQLREALASYQEAQLQLDRTSLGGVAATDAENFDKASAAGVGVNGEVRPDKLTEYKNMADELSKDSASPFGHSTAEAPYGTLDGKPIFGRGADNVKDGVLLSNITQGTNNGEIVYEGITVADTPLLQSKYDELLGRLAGLEKEKGATLTEQEVLQEVSKYSQEVLSKSTHEVTSAHTLELAQNSGYSFTFANGQKAKVVTVPLDYFIETGDGVCRHTAVFSEYLMQQLVDDQILNGVAKIDESGSAVMGVSHIWVRYTDGAGMDFILDTRHDIAEPLSSIVERLPKDPADALYRRVIGMNDNLNNELKPDLLWDYRTPDEISGYSRIKAPGEAIKADLSKIPESVEAASGATSGEKAATEGSAWAAGDLTEAASASKTETASSEVQAAVNNARQALVDKDEEIKALRVQYDNLPDQTTKDAESLLEQLKAKYAERRELQSALSDVKTTAAETVQAEKDGVIVGTAKKVVNSFQDMVDSATAKVQSYFKSSEEAQQLADARSAARVAESASRAEKEAALVEEIAGAQGSAKDWGLQAERLNQKGAELIAQQAGSAAKPLEQRISEVNSVIESNMGSSGAYMRTSDGRVVFTGEQSTTTLANVENLMLEDAAASSRAMGVSNPKVLYLQKDLGDVSWVGDLHGDYESMVRAVAQSGIVDDPDKIVVFLGDYIDRGDKDAETFQAVLKLKEKYPEQVYMLRGNHEDFASTMSSQTYKGFVGANYGNAGIVEHQEFFESMPLGIVIDDTQGGGRAFGVHGFVPNVNSGDVALSELANPDETLLKQMLWNDPAADGVASPSYRGNLGFETQTSAEDVRNFLDKNNITYVVRGHEQSANVAAQSSVVERMSGLLGQDASGLERNVFNVFNNAVNYDIGGTADAMRLYDPVLQSETIGTNLDSIRAELEQATRMQQQALQAADDAKAALRAHRAQSFVGDIQNFFGDLTDRLSVGLSKAAVSASDDSGFISIGSNPGDKSIIQSISDFFAARQEAAAAKAVAETHGENLTKVGDAIEQLAKSRGVNLAEGEALTVSSSDLTAFAKEAGYRNGDEMVQAVIDYADSVKNDRPLVTLPTQEDGTVRLVMGTTNDQLAEGYAKNGISAGGGSKLIKYDPEAALEGVGKSSNVLVVDIPESEIGKYYGLNADGTVDYANKLKVAIPSEYVSSVDNNFQATEKAVLGLSDKARTAAIGEASKRVQNAIKLTTSEVAAADKTSVASNFGSYLSEAYKNLLSHDLSISSNASGFWSIVGTDALARSLYYGLAFNTINNNVINSSAALTAYQQAMNQGQDMLTVYDVTKVPSTATQAAVVTLNGASNLTIKKGAKFTDPGAKATDGSTVTVSGSVNTSVPGTYTLKYTTRDKNGNISKTVTRTVVVTAGEVEDSGLDNSASTNNGSSNSGSSTQSGSSANSTTNTPATKTKLVPVPKPWVDGVCKIKYSSLVQGDNNSYFEVCGGVSQVGRVTNGLSFFTESA